jgi:hypothetical protein
MRRVGATGIEAPGTRSDGPLEDLYGDGLYSNGILRSANSL